MTPLRRRYVLLSTAIVLLGLAVMLEVVLVTKAYAEGNIPALALPVFDLLSVSGLIALGGMLVAWGRMQQQMKDFTAFKREMREEFQRVHRKVDKLFELVGAERRSPDRYRFGERVEGDDPEE